MTSPPTQAVLGVPLRVALVGYGYAGSTFHAPLLNATPGLVLSVVVSSNPDRVARECPDCAVLDFDSLLKRVDIDLVVIATPNSTHFDLARQALLAGKHVVVDKPFTLTLSEAQQLVGLAESNSRLITVFHNRRWDGDFMMLRHLIQSGELGRITTLESRFDRFRPEVRARWRERDEPGAGTWFDLGPHLIDQALLLFGMPAGVYADLCIQRDGARAVDCLHVILRYEALRVVLSSSYLAADPGPRYRVFGTAGTFIKYGVDPQEDALRAGQRPGNDSAWGLDPQPGKLIRARDGVISETDIASARGNYVNFYAAVRDAIAGGADPPVSAAEALTVMRILELASLSSVERREIPVVQFAPT